MSHFGLFGGLNRNGGEKDGSEAMKGGWIVPSRNGLVFWKSRRGLIPVFQGGASWLSIASRHALKHSFQSAPPLNVSDYFVGLSPTFRDGAAVRYFVRLSKKISRIFNARRGDAKKPNLVKAAKEATFTRS